VLGAHFVASHWPAQKSGATKQQPVVDGVDASFRRAFLLRGLYLSKVKRHSRCTKNEKKMSYSQYPKSDRLAQGQQFTVPSALEQQYSSMAHRNAARECRMAYQSEQAMRQFAQPAATLAPYLRQATANGRYIPCGAERLQQTNARDELYTPVAPPESQQRAIPLADGPSTRRLETIDARLDTMARREALLADEARQRANNAALSGNATTTMMMHSAAQRNVNSSVDAVQAEKNKYQAEYQKGNEEAYAHVAALQKACRGYEDTSKQTLDQVKQWNAREAQRRQFFSAY